MKGGHNWETAWNSLKKAVLQSTLEVCEIMVIERLKKKWYLMEWWSRKC